MAVDGIDPAVPVIAVRGLEGVVSASVARQRFTMGLTAAFAGLAALLGASGIHGLLSYLVSQRRREIGVRLALGATPSLVRRDVVWRGTRLALAGATAGLVAAFGASGALAGLLYGVSAHDPLTFATVPVLFVMIAVVASWVPARRAMRGDPAQVLREG